MTEEEVKLRIITPAIEQAGWDKHTQINMEYVVSKGKVIVRNGLAKRSQISKLDYLLSYKNGIPLAIVEAKDDSHRYGDGMVQAKQYATKMDVRFVYTSNGDGFCFYDMKTGKEKRVELNEFPKPQELYDLAYGKQIAQNKDLAKVINTPYHFSDESYPPRYYQSIAINRTVDAVSKGQDKLLLVMATGTGKTYVAFQIIWRLWKSGLKKKILYLADRNILIDQTIIGDFKPFKNKMTKISHKKGEKINTAYEIYLSLYQQLSDGNEEDPIKTLKDSFDPDFFDLIIVDECHRGSARDESNWRKILDYFKDATKIGMTATPKETKTVSNIDYFGDPIFTYSLKDGIEDGYLAPYRVVRYALNKDVLGYRPEKGKLDKHGNLVDDREYTSADFDRTIVIDERTKEVARLITDHLKSTNRMDKTIVFCVDIDHAERMRQELTNLNSDMCAKDHRYVMRITGDDLEAKKQLDYFIDDESAYPTIVTTSKLLNTGVNCRTCKNIVLDNFFGENGMTEFKQIIGRGTRIVENKDKLFFNVLDFRNASRLFADPEFNGTDVQDEDYNPKKKPKKIEVHRVVQEANKTPKFYIDGVEVKLLSERIQYYDKDGKLITESLRDYTKKNILNTFESQKKFIEYWSSDEKREVIIDELEKQGIFLKELRKQYKQNVDDFDLIMDVAYGIKPIPKSQRIKNAKLYEVLKQYSESCRDVLNKLLTIYSETEQNDLTDISMLRLPEFNEYGSPMKIVDMFGGKEAYFLAVRNVQRALYA